MINRTALDALWAAIEAAAPLQVFPDDPVLAPALDFDDSSERTLFQSDRRRTFIALYAWAVPTRQAIQTIAAFVAGRKALEVCAGSGLWARLLADRGLQVIATDAEPAPDPHFPVEALEAEAAVQAHGDSEALLLCWPPFRADCAVRALRAFRGDRLVYVGDARFTADDRFHALVGKEWIVAQSIPLPSWPGLDDYTFLYQRR